MSCCANEFIKETLLNNPIDSYMYIDRERVTINRFRTNVITGTLLMCCLHATHYQIQYNLIQFNSIQRHISLARGSTVY
jgi:hypothetical protein